MFVTDDMFHADRSLAKLDEEANISTMLVTDDVSRLQSWTKKQKFQPCLSPTTCPMPTDCLQS